MKIHMSKLYECWVISFKSLKNIEVFVYLARTFYRFIAMMTGLKDDSHVM